MGFWIPEWSDLASSQERCYPKGSTGKESICNARDTKDSSSILGWGKSLEKEMATHCNILTWKIPWTEAHKFSSSSRKHTTDFPDGSVAKNLPASGRNAGLIPDPRTKIPHTVCVSHLVVSDSVTPWTVALQAPLSMRFSRQEHWGGLPFPSPGYLPNPGIKPGSLALQANSLPSEL